jgi:hypothetical protein
MSVQNEDLIKRFEQADSDRAVIESMWDAIETFITPYRGRFFNDQKDEGSIEWFRHRQVYDSTAVMAHQNLSASLHGSLTSPSIRWFDIRFRQESLNKNRQASRWLQESTDRVFYALQDSNFNLEINEAYQDLVGFGTAFVSLEESKGPAGAWNGLNFAGVPLKEAFFDQDEFGQASRFYRRLEWTPQQYLSKFGDKVPQVVKDLDDKGDTTKRSLLYVVFPRNNKIVPLGQKVSPSRRPWEYRYIDLATKEDCGTSGGYYEMPVYAPRWRKTSMSMWGNSPAMVALADVLSLNEARKMQLMAAEKHIDPPIFAEERALITDLDLSARGLNVVRDIAGVQPFRMEGNYGISQDVIAQLQDSVRNYFFTNQLDFPNPQAQPMTATEAQIRYELMQRLLGPTLGRLQNDLLDPIVSRTFRMLSRDGQIEEPPAVVMESEADFDIQYLGALVRAQRVDNAAAIERVIMTVGGLAEVMPDMVDNIDQNAVVGHLVRDLNAPADIVVDEKEVAKKQAERKQVQAEMMETEMAGQEAEVAASMNEATGGANDPGLAG